MAADWDVGLIDIPYLQFDPPTRRIVLIGGGRNASNMVGLFEGVDLEIAAILDDTPIASVLGHAVVAIDSYRGPDRAAIMAVADPHVRRSLERRDSLSEMIWTRYIDPRAVVSRYAKIGAGTFVAPFVACADAIIGRHASIMAGVVLGTKVSIGDFSSVLPNATIASEARIGCGSVIGMGARIEAGTQIGDYCRVAANVVVRHDLPDGSMIAPRAQARIFRKGVPTSSSES